MKSRVLWHYQLVHHDLWDYDPAAAPNLIDITVDGRPIKAVAQVTKHAFTFVFDRVTGEPVWPIEERPVAPSTVPGEWTSPTQPFPSRPPPFDRQGVTEADLIDFTPELRAPVVQGAIRSDHRDRSQPGEIAWQRANGPGSPAIRNHPRLRDVGLPPLGGGRDLLLVTKTLLLSGQQTLGADDEWVLAARDKATGELLAEVPLTGRAIGSPMTYEAGGRQYVALTVRGARNGPPELVAPRGGTVIAQGADDADNKDLSPSSHCLVGCPWRRTGHGAERV